MGKPKQLLNYNGITLLKYTTQIALDSNASTLIVVLGANAGLLNKEIENENADNAEHHVSVDTRL